MKNSLSLAPVLTALLGLALVTSVTTGCGGDKKPAESVATQPTAATPPVTAKPANADKMAVNVDDDIVKACNLKFENIEDAPKFDYDTDALTQGEKNVLEAIAKCLTTGPLKGKAVDLVGRADPRGETEYNMTLGAKRARSVHSYLGGLGVPGDKLHDTSRGELDAKGTDEDGWRKDRRVDVRLAK
ncbi:MAG: peptidoglycan-associated outer rane lipoprotein [Labilithrix sp.]|nr:peptidoglycan-associated outer rane lipoprotein [Labilithrix sp.]